MKEPVEPKSDGGDSVVAKAQYLLCFFVIFMVVADRFGWPTGLAICSAILLLAPTSPFGVDPK